MEKVIGGEQGPGMALWGVDSPEACVDLPVEVFEEVDDGFERVVSPWLGFGKLLEQDFDGELIVGVEKEVFPKCGKGGRGDGCEWVSFSEVGGKKKGEMSFSCSSCIVKVCPQYEGAEVFDYVE